MEKGNSVFCIYLILKEYSNEKNPLTQQKIIDYLRNEYDIFLERKAVSKKLNDLEDVLFLQNNKERLIRGKNGCYLSKLFKDSEIQVLLSSVVSNKHIDEKHTKEYLDKLCSLAQKGFTSGLRDIRVVGDWAKLKMDNYFADMEIIHKAIADNKKISYYFNLYDTVGAQLKLMHTTKEPHICTPYGLVAHGDKIYLCLCREHKNMETGTYQPENEISFQRLDRLSDVKILEETGVNVFSLEGCKQGIDYKAIATGMPFMYAGPHELIIMETDHYTLDQLVDACGTSFQARKLEENKYEVRITASPKAMVYWAVQYSERVKVTYPQSVVKEVKKILSDALKKYE